MDIDSLRAHQLKALCGRDSFERGAVSRKDVGEVGATTAERSTVRPTNKSDSLDRMVAMKEDRVDSIVDQDQDQQQQLQKMRDLPFHVASIGGTNVVQFNDHLDNGLMQIDGEVRNHLDGLAMKRPHIDTSSSSSSSSLDKDKEHTITVGEHDRVHLLHGSNSRLKVNEVKSKESSQKILSLLKAKKNDQSKD